jgi:hypothetical protein
VVVSLWKVDDALYRSIDEQFLSESQNQIKSGITAASAIGNDSRQDT